MASHPFDVSRKRFRDGLLSLLAAAEAGRMMSGHVQQFRSDFLMFGSETEDNLAAMDVVEFGWVEELAFGLLDGRFALRLKDAPLAISSLTHAMEGEGVPESLRLAFPTLTAKQFDAAMRVVTNVLVALEVRGPNGGK